MAEVPVVAGSAGSIKTEAIIGITWHLHLLFQNLKPLSEEAKEDEAEKRQVAQKEMSTQTPVVCATFMTP